MLYRPAFVSAMQLLGRVSRSFARMAPGARLPVLVGGAVVEFDTAGGFVSGDFDFVTERDAAFVSALQEAGFVPDRRPGRLQRPGGWVHPGQCIGVDMVSGALFDGRTDARRMRVVDLGGGAVAVPPVEDMIADRLGQWEASNRRDDVLLAQAGAMLALAAEVDRVYLARRVGEEVGDPAAAGPLLTLLEAVRP